MEVQTKTGLNEMFNLLAHPHRRYILYHLTQKSETVDLDTLAASLATRDGSQPGESRNTSRKLIKVQLHHRHLPKLSNAGLITFARDRQSIELNGMNGYGQFIEEAARIDGYAPPVIAD